MDKAGMELSQIETSAWKPLERRYTVFVFHNLCDYS